MCLCRSGHLPWHFRVFKSTIFTLKNIIIMLDDSRTVWYLVKQSTYLFWKAVILARVLHIYNKNYKKTHIFKKMVIFRIIYLNLTPEKNNRGKYKYLIWLFRLFSVFRKKLFQIRQCNSETLKPVFPDWGFFLFQFAPLFSKGGAWPSKSVKL